MPSSNIDILNENKNNSFKKTFGINLLFNFKELHPIANLSRISLISPLILNSWLFVFKIFILFGFNALLYDENLIELSIIL